MTWIAKPNWIRKFRSSNGSCQNKKACGLNGSQAFLLVLIGKCSRSAAEPGFNKPEAERGDSANDHCGRHRES